MKKLIWGLILVFLVQGMQAQFGLRTSYGFGDAGNWNDQYHEQFSEDSNLFNQSLEIGADYWFRLKKKRVEFMPTLFLSREKNSPYQLDGVKSLSKNSLGLKFNVNIYPFDFAGDCDCPTFSKQGNFFTKGFFLNIAPGYTFNHFSVWSQNPDEVTNVLNLRDGASTGNMIFSFGGGIDIGINDLVTISPFIQYDIYPNMHWQEFNIRVESNASIDANTTTYTKVHFGIRVGFRRDYTNRYGR